MASVGLNIVLAVKSGVSSQWISSILSNEERSDGYASTDGQKKKSASDKRAKRGDINPHDGRQAAKGNGVRVGKQVGKGIANPVGTASGKANGTVVRSTATDAKKNASAPNRGTSRAKLDWRQQTQRQIEEKYEFFFEKKSMDEKNRNLIVAAFMKDFELILGAVDGKYDHEDRNAKREERQRLFEKTLRGPLGDEAYEELLFYRDTLSLRGWVNGLADYMSAANCPLGADNIEMLVRLVLDGDSMPQYVFPERNDAFSQQEAKRNALRMIREKDTIMSEAGKHLNQKQMEALNDYWDSHYSNLTEEERNNPSEALAKMRNERRSLESSTEND